MGARQSKRSVDITSSKEGEAAAGAGAISISPDGEARLEKIAELHVSPAPLKPQLNGDAARIEAHTPDKEKLVLEESAPENDKDGSNEKEVVIVPTLNGLNSEAGGPLEDQTLDSELETASDAKVAEADSNKKNKKEKVKKKWSFRSISFSKKDKQKPAKKEENGEYAQLPEESQEAAAPVTTESTESKASEEILLIKDEKSDDKTPETPVTEPLTNGSSTPESPKEEARQNGDLNPIEQPSEDLPIEAAPRVDLLVESNPENLTLNGLQINDIPNEDIQPPAEPVPVSVVSSTPILDGSPNEPIPVNLVLAEPIPTESLSAELPAPEELKTDISPELEVPPPPALIEIVDAPADPVAVIPEPEITSEVATKIASSTEPVVEAASEELVPTPPTDNGVAE